MAKYVIYCIINREQTHSALRPTPLFSLFLHSSIFSSLLTMIKKYRLLSGVAAEAQ